MVASNTPEKPIVKALIEAKREFKPFVKNKINPHYKSAYADMTAVASSVDEALAKHGLTYVQPFEWKDGLLFIYTRLMHTSGDELTSTYPINVQGHKPQEVGGAITYGRRYALTSLLGLAADDDDDGNEAPHDTTPAKPAPKPKSEGTWTEPQTKKEQKAVDEGKKDGLCNTTIRTVEPKEKNGIKFMALVTPAGEFAVLESPHRMEILTTAQKAMLGKVQVVIEYHTSKGGTNIVDSLKEVA